MGHSVGHHGLPTAGSHNPQRHRPPAKANHEAAITQAARLQAVNSQNLKEWPQRDRYGRMCCLRLTVRAVKRHQLWEAPACGSGIIAALSYHSLQPLTEFEICSGLSRVHIFALEWWNPPMAFLLGRQPIKQPTAMVCRASNPKMDSSDLLKHIPKSLPEKVAALESSQTPPCCKFSERAGGTLNYAYCIPTTTKGKYGAKSTCCVHLT